MEQKKRAELVEKVINLGQDDALEIAKLVIDHYKVGFQSADYINDLLEIAGDCDRFGVHERALSFYQKAEKRSLAVGDTNLIGSIYSGMGISYNYLKEYDNSIKFYEKALNIFQAEGNMQEVGILKNNLGFVYKNILQFQESIKSYIDAIEIFREIDDKFSMSASYFNIADIFKSLKDYETALKYIEKCIEIDKELNLESIKDDLAYKNDLLIRSGKKTREEISAENKSKNEDDVFFDDDDENIEEKSKGKGWWPWKRN